MRKLNLLSSLFEPTRIFIAILIAVIFWLFPFLSFKEQTVRSIAHGNIISAAPYTAGAIGECSNVVCDPGYCCQFGYCVVRNKADCNSGGSGDQPPTISASLNCSQPGDNGWCTGSLSADFSASDPQGQSILISGTLDGVAFACPDGATSCSIPIDNEGSGVITYQVDSATGLSANGSISYQLDISSPDLNTSLSGISGTNNWYTSDVSLDVAGDDSISGLSSITASVNNETAFTVNGPLNFSDGIYSVTLTAFDKAGNSTQDTQTIQVDTITPSLSLVTNGTSGSNGWYISSTTVTPTASDSGSGLAALEAKVDNGSWTAVSGSLSLSDGIHMYQFRAMDYAGNTTESPMQTLRVDTIGPSIDMTAELSLGETVYYELQDKGSGLSIYRAVIEDDDERHKKIVWLDSLSGSKFKDQILWDGKFADGTSAGVGEYYITLKISDAAGNESRKTAIVTVHPFSFLQNIPTFIPPSTSSQDTSIQGSQTVLSPEQSVTSFGGVTVTANAGAYTTTKTTLTGASQPATNKPLNPNILWGAAAAAVAGATLADWERKRKEEEQAQQNAIAQKRANTEKRWAQKAQEDSVRQRWEEEARQQRANAASTARWEGLAALEAAKAQDRINDATAARWAGVADIEQSKEEQEISGGGTKPLAIPVQDDPPPPKTFWEKVTAWWKEPWFWEKPGIARTNLEATQTAAIQTAWSQITLTAMPTLTSTPTTTPTPLPTITPTPNLPIYYITDQGIRFRKDPIVEDSNIISKLVCGTAVQIISDQQVNDGKNIWQKVRIDKIDGWIAKEYLDGNRPVCTNFASKYATYPGAGINIQIDQLPFDYPNPYSLPSWWGFGNTTFARDHKTDYYLKTTGMHSGIDWGVPAGTKLVWSGNHSGVAIKNSSYIYMSDPNYIIIESNGFHFIYGHTSKSIVEPGQTISPGEIIGYSGTPSSGDPHLHFEVRPAPSDGSKSSFVINPLTFFTPQLQSEWTSLFNGDYYLPGDDPLSLGYFMNTTVKP
jgi:murein DD-endopeptidase MepM/ murein hydrolase activator NlpD